MKTENKGTKRKQSVVGVVLTALFVCMVTGCGGKNPASGEQASGKETTRVVLNEVAHSAFYAPMYVAVEEGYFAEEGIDLELVTGYGADKTMTALLTGEADIGFMGSESSIYTYLGGTQDYAVNFAQLTQRAGNFLVAREPVEDFDWSFLQGQDVLGGRAGGMPEMVFEYILKKHNMNPKTDLNIDQSIDFGSTAAAFSGGQGTYTVEFEPYATSLEQKGDGYVVASLGEASGYVPYTAFSAKKSYLEANPEIIREFVNALKRGMEFVDAHTSEEIAKSIAPQFKETEEESLTIIIERYKGQDSWKSDLMSTEESFTLLQNILEEAGELSQRVPYEDLVNMEFVK